MDYLIIGCNGRVAAINPLTGNMKWETKLPVKYSSYQDVNVLIDEDLIYAGCHGYLFCLDLHNGTLKWQNNLKGWGLNDITLALKDKSIQIMAKTSGGH